MLTELSAVLGAAPADGDRSDYAEAIIEGNCLGKPTTATRRHTNQRLGELYGLDPNIPLFRILRRLWNADQHGQPLLALLVGLARDPLLLATASSVLALPQGAEFQRTTMREALRSLAGERLNESILDKVVRNAASSWTQSGHLEGRTFKFRRLVRATPPTIALALFLSYSAGFRGAELFTSGWIAVLDCTPSTARDLALEAKRLGLLDLRMAGEVVEVGFERLDALFGRQ
jgi:hypothetical protein